MALNHIRKSGKHVNKKAADNFKNIKPEVEKLKSFSCTAENQTEWRGLPRRKRHLLMKRYETHATDSQISEGIEWGFTIFEEQVTEGGLLGPSVCKHSTDDRSQPWIHYRFCLFLQHRCWNFNIYVSVLNERTAWPGTSDGGGGSLAHQEEREPGQTDPGSGEQCGLHGRVVIHLPGSEGVLTEPLLWEKRGGGEHS